MFLLDEHVLDNQLDKLILGHLPVKKIGRGVGRKGMDDYNQIIPMLHLLAKTTFFTHDLGFYKRKFCHSCYCMVILRVGRYEAAKYIRRFLKHADFNTHNKRMGWVIEVHKTVIKGIRVGRTDEFKFAW